MRILVCFLMFFCVLNATQTVRYPLKLAFSINQDGELMLNREKNKHNFSIATPVFSKRHGEGLSEGVEDHIFFSGALQLSANHDKSLSALGRECKRIIDRKLQSSYSFDDDNFKNIISSLTRALHNFLTEEEKKEPGVKLKCNLVIAEFRKNHTIEYDHWGDSFSVIPDCNIHVATVGNGMFVLMGHKGNVINYCNNSASRSLENLLTPTFKVIQNTQSTTFIVGTQELVQALYQYVGLLLQNYSVLKYMPASYDVLTDFMISYNNFVKKIPDTLIYNPFLISELNKVQGGVFQVGNSEGLLTSEDRTDVVRLQRGLKVDDSVRNLRLKKRLGLPEIIRKFALSSPFVELPVQDGKIAPPFVSGIDSRTPAPALPLSREDAHLINSFFNLQSQVFAQYTEQLDNLVTYLQDTISDKVNMLFIEKLQLERNKCRELVQIKKFKHVSLEVLLKLARNYNNYCFKKDDTVLQGYSVYTYFPASMEVENPHLKGKSGMPCYLVFKD